MDFLERAAGLIAEQADPPARNWHLIARPKQLAPDNPRHHEADANGYRCGCDGADDTWSIFLLLAGRGLGKTLSGANWSIEEAIAQPGTVGAAIGPTFRDTRNTCFEGPSGILKQLQPGELKQWRRNELRLDLSNGSIIFGFSADQPERLRGTNLAFAWVEELGSWRYPETWYEGLIPALRIGRHPRIVVTTTPRPTALIRDLMKRTDGSVHVTRGSTWENAANLSAAALEELRRRYEGTRLGRQELEGELLEDVPGALWKISDIDAARVREDGVPDLVRVVVGVDPAMTSGENADETGIVVAGEDGTGHAYVLGDYSMRGTPDECMRKAVWAWHHHCADVVVAEVNNGGDWIGNALRHVDPKVPYRTVRASRGKAIRAEPVSALYEQLRVHHVGCFPQLEDQMISFVPDLATGHDDRLDALTWSISELRGLSGGSWLAAYGTKRCEDCQNAYPDAYPSCPRCNPAVRREAPPEADPSTQPMTGWGAAYGAARCPAGHTFIARRHKDCPRCAPGGGVRGPMALPSLPGMARFR